MKSEFNVYDRKANEQHEIPNRDLSAGAEHADPPPLGVGVTWASVTHGRCQPCGVGVRGPGVMRSRVEDITLSERTLEMIKNLISQILRLALVLFPHS